MISCVPCHREVPLANTKAKRAPEDHFRRPELRYANAEGKLHPNPSRCKVQHPIELEFKCAPDTLWFCGTHSSKLYFSASQTGNSLYERLRSESELHCTLADPYLASVTVIIPSLSPESLGPMKRNDQRKYKLEH